MTTTVNTSGGYSVKIMHLFEKLLHEQEQNSAEGGEGSVEICDPEIIKKFISNSENTFLVSFPRTGSHWLRALMELYFERPSLVRAFYFPENKDYLTYHTHDLKLDIEHSTVLYLYRNPVDTIYSQLNYHKEALDDTTRIIYWSDLYGHHLNKWLHDENFTNKKTVLRYEGLKLNMPTEFAKITHHFGVELDVQKLAQVSARSTKEEIKLKTVHDQQVINLKKEYDDQRKAFTRIRTDIIWDTLLKNHPDLGNDFL